MIRNLSGKQNVFISATFEGIILRQLFCVLIVLIVSLGCEIYRLIA